MRFKTRSFLKANRGAVLLSVVAAVGCGANPDIDAEESFGRTEGALTSQQGIFGFEAPLGWTGSAGNVGISTTHTEGASSLSLRNANYSLLTSQALSTLSGVGAELAIDVLPPAVASWGQLEFYATSATLGWTSYQWLGQVSLAGLPVGQFAHLKVPLSAAQQQKLKQSYSDLQIRLAVNAPASSTGWLLDNLHFTSLTQDCAAGSAYALTFVNQTGVDATMLENLRCTFFATYPLLAQRFNPNASKNVTFSFVENDKNPAWAEPGISTIFLNKAHLAAHPLDSDVVVHEGMHIVQAGYQDPVQGWIIEGSADYARDRYGLRNLENGWSIPKVWAPGRHYANGYGDAAGFFEWIDAQYRQNKPGIVDALDDVMRSGVVSSATWIALTGYDVVPLWAQYSNNQAPVQAPAGITFYRDDNYTGLSFTIGTGTYGSTELGSRALQDAISSLKVPSGWRVTAYEHDGSQGASIQYTADTPSVGSTWNDKISTVVISNP